VKGRIKYNIAQHYAMGKKKSIQVGATTKKRKLVLMGVERRKFGASLSPPPSPPAQYKK